LDKKGSHIIDNADRVAKTYDLYKSLSSLKNGDSKAISSGIYAYAQTSHDLIRTNQKLAVDSILTGGKVFARIENDVRFEGAQFDIEEFDVEAKNFSYMASSNESTIDSSHFDAEFQVALPVPGQMTQAGVKLVKSVKESSLNASKKGLQTLF
jgi:hypothetical protein